MKKLFLVLVALTMLLACAPLTAKADTILGNIKDVVTERGPELMPVYDLIDHEMKQFASIDLYQQGRFSVPGGYLSTDAVAIAARYTVLKSGDYTGIPLLDSVDIAPTAGIGFVDFSNVLSKPSSLTKDNFSIFVGIVGVKKF